ncbi:hypothetical protein J5N97_014615 [Dioscorea zingiberensis]|uniref:NAC domain-containing protein n=1 Tax=Dioscorea zingiberensis TaxID=325984 RepID=A0A9D5HJW0_9LILI|nr:hypothetical protein J5N97_014615 [Dioscorea zingiberensis]
MGEDQCLDLPPGFRFHPTDEEIITHYLYPKALNHNYTARAIGDVDLNKCEPWDLPSKAKMGEKEWYFFCQKDKKYPTGTRTNRATEAGYWKATGKDKEIHRGRGLLVGMKKTLVFYRGRAPKGEKTNWVMHEFRLEGKTTSKDGWVVCKVFHKSNGAVKKNPLMVNSIGDHHELLEYSQTLPPLMDEGFIPSNNYSMIMNSSYYPQVAPPNTCFQVSTTASHDHDQAMMRAAYGGGGGLGRECKMEQVSNQSIISQDTGLSTDRNTESSRPYDDFDDPCSSVQVMDLENLWKY